jgi:hypothetical protein
VDEVRRCPGCRAPTTGEGETPADGSILSCTLCGFIGIWDAALDDWRNPTDEERSELFSDEEFLRIQEAMMGLRMFHAQEMENLRQGIRESLEPFMPPLPGKLLAAARERALDRMADAAASVVHDRGYHRHPNAAERRMYDILEDLG